MLSISQQRDLIPYLQALSLPLTYIVGGGPHSTTTVPSKLNSLETTLSSVVVQTDRQTMHRQWREGLTEWVWTSSHGVIYNIVHLRPSHPVTRCDVIGQQGCRVLWAGWKDTAECISCKLNLKHPPYVEREWGNWILHPIWLCSSIACRLSDDSKKHKGLCHHWGSSYMTICLSCI